MPTQIEFSHNTKSIGRVGMSSSMPTLLNCHVITSPGLSKGPALSVQVSSDLIYDIYGQVRSSL